MISALLGSGRLACYPNRASLRAIIRSRFLSRQKPRLLRLFYRELARHRAAGFVAANGEVLGETQSDARADKMRNVAT